MSEPAFDLRPTSLAVVRELCAAHHGYKSTGNNATYAFAVFEDSVPVAAYVWQPPPPGAAKAICPEAPHGVLALSRMVAVPKGCRRLQHVSRPLRRQMRALIDRTRWPVLVTYSDEGEGHTGHVYKCSGWEKTERARRPRFVDEHGARASRYANGKADARPLTSKGYTTIQRWEHWVCARGKAQEHMSAHGWERVRIEGKVWKSGQPAHTYRKQELAVNTPVIPDMNIVHNDAQSELGASQALVQQYSTMVISSDVEYTDAGQALVRLSKKIKAAEEKRLKWTEPLRAVVDDINATFKPAVEGWKTLVVTLKNAMTTYERQVNAQKQQALLVAAQAAQQGNFQQAHAAAAFAGSEQVVAKGIGSRENWNWRVVNAAVIPREFLMVDEKKVNAFVGQWKGQTQIPGIAVERSDIKVVRG